MKSDRMLSILLHLQSKGRASAASLSRKLEVSQRTIHRDMESLAASGIPVYAERGRKGGWQLSEGYRTNLTGMKRDELRSLFLFQSSRALADLGMNDSYDDALLKLLASLPPSYRRDVELIRERVYVVGPGWQMESSDLLPVLHSAVDHCRTLRVEYAKGEKSMQRMVDPLGLIARGPVWYLATREGKKYRTFRVSNLRTACPTGTTFSRPVDFDLRAYWQQWWKEYQSSLPVYQVVVRMPESQGAMLRNAPWLKVIKTTVAGGMVTGTIDAETQENAVRLLLWLGAGVTVLRPRSLRKFLAEEARRIHLKNHPDAASGRKH